MRRFENNFGDIVTDQKEYYVCISDEPANEDFITIGDPENFYTDYYGAVRYAKAQSLKHAAVNLCCERWIHPDEGGDMYDAPMTIWHDRYEQGKKQWREIHDI